MYQIVKVGLGGNCANGKNQVENSKDEISWEMAKFFIQKKWVEARTFWGEDRKQLWIGGR